jgi:hypothetical protein
VSRSDGERLAQLEVAFQGVRRVHTMGLFYHADLRCQEKCGHCDGRCELVCGHQGDHHCKYHGSGNRCPLCDGLWLAEMSSAENGLILSGPSVNFAPAFFQWIERACP